MSLAGMMVVSHPLVILLLVVIFPIGGSSILQGISVAPQQLGTRPYQRTNAPKKMGIFTFPGQRIILDKYARKPLRAEMSDQAMVRRRTSEGVAVDKAVRNAGHFPEQETPLVLVRKFPPWDADDKVQKAAHRLHGLAHISLIVGEFLPGRGFVGTEWDLQARPVNGDHTGVPIEIFQMPFLMRRSYPPSEDANLEYVGKLKTRSGVPWCMSLSF